jgi:hypothetical protein
MGDMTLRRGVSYQRKWRLDLRTAAQLKAAEQYAKGQCKITIRANALYVGDTYYSEHKLLNIKDSFCVGHISAFEETFHSFGAALCTAQIGTH